MKRGISVTLVQSCETWFARKQRGCTLYGELGTIIAGRDGAVANSTDLEGPQSIAYADEPLSEYALEFRAFADLVLEGTDGPTDAWAEIRSLAVVQAGYESAKSGVPVNLWERFGEAVSDA